MEKQQPSFKGESDSIHRRRLGMAAAGHTNLMQVLLVKIRGHFLGF
jgi:hypothetical protein